MIPATDTTDRLDALLLERMSIGTPAMAISLGVLTVVSWYEHHPAVAALSFGTQAAAALAWWSIHAKRVPTAWAGALSLALWLCAEVTLLAALVVNADVTQEVWLALILWAYGAMQLKNRWFVPAVLIGTVAWGAVITWLGVSSLLMHFVTISAAAGVSVLSFGANRAVVHDLERLRASDHQRQLDLERALAAARHEVAEREAAEFEREQLRNQFVESQRMEAIGTLAGGLAHDMNNVLAGILGMAKAMRLSAEGDAAEDLDAIVSSADRGVALTRSLLGFSRRAQYEKRRISVADVVAETVQVLRRTLPKPIEIVDDLDPSVHVDADRGHLGQALMNVCINSTHAIGERGRIAVSVAATPVEALEATRLAIEPGNYAAIRVRDDGCGMDEAVRQRVFDPFFTTKRVGDGTGLGLAMVWGMLKSHGGTALVESRPGGGTLLTMLLPLQASPQAVGANERSPMERRADAPHLLVVDDEPIVRRVTVRAAQRAGFTVSEAADGLEAIEQFSANPSAVHGVVLDMSMPRMNGAQCYRALRDLQPHLPIVCVSGYALDEDARLHLGGDVVFLAKPFDAEDLAEALKRAFSLVAP